jgi:hypothetical protein
VTLENKLDNEKTESNSRTNNNIHPRVTLDGVRRPILVFVIDELDHGLLGLVGEDFQL